MTQDALEYLVILNWYGDRLSGPPSDRDIAAARRVLDALRPVLSVVPHPPYRPSPYEDDPRLAPQRAAALRSLELLEADECL